MSLRAVTHLQKSEVHQNLAVLSATYRREGMFLSVKHSPVRGTVTEVFYSYRVGVLGLLLLSPTLLYKGVEPTDCLCCARLVRISIPDDFDDVVVASTKTSIGMYRQMYGERFARLRDTFDHLENAFTSGYDMQELLGMRSDMAVHVYWRLSRYLSRFPVPLLTEKLA